MIAARSGRLLTTDSPEAAEQYQLAVDRILGAETIAPDALDSALAVDGSLGLALAARHMLARDARSADAELFRERVLLAAEAYIAAHPGDLLLVSQLCGCLIVYGGARKLERVLKIMESINPGLHDDWACLARLGLQPVRPVTRTVVVLLSSGRCSSDSRRSLHSSWLMMSVSLQGGGTLTPPAH